MKVWPLKKISMFSSPPLHSLHGKREVGSFCFHFHGRLLGFFLLGLILYGHFLLISITLKSGAFISFIHSFNKYIDLWLSSSILTTPFHILLLLSLLLQLTPVYPWGCHWHMAMNPSRISKHRLCNGPMTANLQTCYEEQTQRNNACSVQLQDSARSRADIQQVALLWPLLLPVHSHASSLSPLSQKSKPHSDCILRGRAFAISWHFKETQGERNCDKDSIRGDPKNSKT